MARNKHPEKTVQKILEVSLKLFGEKGYDKTTIQDIVDRLGMSKGAIYHHFKSKEEIMDTICTQTYDMIQETQKNLIRNKNMTGLEKIREMFKEQLCDMDKRHIDQISINYLQNPQILMANLKENMTKGTESASEFVIEGMKDGSIRQQDPLLITQITMLLINMWIAVPLEGYDEERLIQKIQYLRYVLESLGAPIINDEVETMLIDYFKWCLQFLTPAA